MASTIAPGAWLGLLGGGQLGRMFCMAAQSLGYRVAVLDPGSEGPASTVSDRHIQADYLDHVGLQTLAELVAGATTEFENVPAAALDFLARHARVTPPASCVAIAQDRIREKGFLLQHGFAVVPYAVLQDEAEAHLAPAHLLPGIVKSARFGYDGKGQRRVVSPAEVVDAFNAMGGRPCVLESLVDLACEVSVIVARTEDGNTQSWPVAENHHRDGILDLSIVPARVTAAVADAARSIATGVADALDYRGVLCVELFVARDRRMLVNEMAPRPHNSGHYTIDACVTSQFEQQVRVLAGLPLGDTRQHAPAVMVNLLGDLWYAEAAATSPREPEWRSVLRHPQAKLHLYGKRQARRGRKMGHVTCLAPTIEEALDVAQEIKRDLGIPGSGSL